MTCRIRHALACRRLGATIREAITAGLNLYVDA